MYHIHVLFLLVMMGAELLFEWGSFPHTLSLFVTNVLLFYQIFLGLRVYESSKFRVKIKTEEQRALKKICEEKRILGEIISISNCMQSETDLIQRLMALVIDKIDSINIIHIATVIHRLAQAKVLSKAKGIVSHEKWILFTTTAKKCVEKESRTRSNLRTAVSIILTLSKHVKDDSEWTEIVICFCESTIDSLDTFSLVQLSNCLSSLCICVDENTKNSTLSMMLKKLRLVSIPQPDLIQLILKCKEASLDDFILATQLFSPDSIHALLTGIDRRCSNEFKEKRNIYRSHIGDRLQLDQDILDACAPLDLVATFQICPDHLRNKMIDSLARKFFSFPIHFIKDVLVDLVGKEPIFLEVFSSHLTTTDLILKIDHCRLALISLLSAGIVPPTDLLDSIHGSLVAARGSNNCMMNSENLGKSLSDLLVLLGLMDDRFSDIFESLFNKVHPQPWITTAALLLNLEFRFDSSKLPYPDLLVLSALTGKPQKKRKEVESFTAARSLLEAACIVKLNPKQKNNYEKALEMIKSTQSVFAIEAVPVALSLMRKVNEYPIPTRSVMREFLLRQIPACSVKILASMVSFDQLRQGAIIELSHRLEHNQISFPKVVSIIACFTRSGVESSHFDDFFGVLQNWLVPKIPKLSLTEVADITNALETFEKRATTIANNINTP